MMRLEVQFKNVDTETWPGFGVGIIKKPETGDSDPEFQLTEDGTLVTVPAWRPRIETPFAYSGSSSNITALTTRTAAYVVNGPAPVRAGETGRGYIGGMVAALTRSGFSYDTMPVEWGPMNMSWDLSPRGHGWTHYGASPDTELQEGVHYFRMPIGPPTGLVAVSPSGGIPAEGSAACGLRIENLKRNGSTGGGYGAHGATVQVVNPLTAGDVEPSTIIQAKWDAPSGVYVVDVEQCGQE